MDKIYIVEVSVLLSNVNKDKKILERDDELEELYQIYLRVQSGEKSALDELFIVADVKKMCKSDERNNKQRMANMDNVLDSELVIENEKNKREEEWVASVHSEVTFQFSCLNSTLYKMKRDMLSTAKSTGYENGKRLRSRSHRKFYEGEYDVSDFNELMYETVVEIFNAKTDEDNYLTLDGKLNKATPICDGVSLLKNIAYFTSIKVNNRAEKSHLDISDIGCFNEDMEEDFEKITSYFDQYAFNEFNKSKNEGLRLAMYAEYLEWLERNDIHKLFNITANDINAIIETIMNCENTFISDISGDYQMGSGMRPVTQETLQKIIKFRHNINIEQTNIAKDMKAIEQRLLDHLLYSLNFKIGKARESNGIYKKESERFLYQLSKKTYIKIFSREIYVIYDESNKFFASDNYDSYFRIIKKYEDTITNIASLGKGKRKYDMINLLSEKDSDLVDNKKETIHNIAKTVVAYYQKQEEEYKKNKLENYKMCGLSNWEKGRWEGELESDILKIKLWSSMGVKKPIRHNIDKGKLLVYCGCMNFYFCDIEKEICYCVPKDKRVISKSNRNHVVSMYKVG